VLLTGATGFLGAYFVREWLTRTPATLVCLVRAASPEHGRDRVAQALRRYGLWSPVFADRIDVVLGDLTAPRLGLSDPDYGQLRDGVDTIVHNGGAVNFLHPYQRLRAPNVQATIELLSLAAAGPPARLHYVSTLGIYLGPGFRHRDITEAVVPDDPDGVWGGYNQTKWVADALVREARERGLAVSIHRPARIAGDGRTGAGNPEDYFSAMLRCFEEVGCVPALTGGEDLSPVDYVAASICHLATQGHDGHYYNDRLLSYDDLAAEMKLPVVPYADWLARVRRGVDDGTVTVFASFATLLAEHEWTREHRFDCTATERRAAAAGIACPPADRALLRRYLDHFVRTGFLKGSP
jgi:thioester reductase-like protein